MYRYACVYTYAYVYTYVCIYIYIYICQPVIMYISFPILTSTFGVRYRDTVYCYPKVQNELL